jgi:DNA-binding CsgD family transcriptional regulator
MQDPWFSAVKLTDTEKRILELLCQGVGPKEIGSRLSNKLTRHSVHNYLQRARYKFGARTTYQLAAMFGMLHPEMVKKGTHVSVDGTDYVGPEALEKYDRHGRAHS